ncbi:ASKHA domain-containing protein [Sporomusa malonica]|nr:ASKHA domain-containing protein [Sporomusa malonica]
MQPGATPGLSAIMEINAMQYTVIFQPSGCQAMVDSGKNLLAASREVGADIEAPCGGSEICGKCKVKIEESCLAGIGIHSKMVHLSPVTDKERKMLSPEELADHYRLACCAQIYGDVLVVVPEQSQALKQVVLEAGTAREFRINPAVRKYYVELNKPTLADCRDDFARLKEVLQSRFIQLDKTMQIDYKVLAKLPDILRQGGWKVTATLWNDSEIIAVEPGRAEKAYGIAIDIGTTTIAAYLCDLTVGQVLAQDSLMNSQVRYGDDVLARITYCMANDDGLAKLHQTIINDINDLIQKMTTTANVNPETVMEVVLVFNTVMHHITLGINPQYIGSAPFASVIREAVNIKARELGINIAESGYVHCLPLEAGFVGADNVAVLIAEQPYKQDKMKLVVDIGTNGEINFGNKEGIFSTSCATGPALEGAQIKFGMRAAPGAIAQITINPETQEPEFEVIGADARAALRARGICGSGIIDAVAELFKAGIIKRDGGFDKNIRSPRVRKGTDGKFEYVLAWAAETALGQDITITQKDVRAVQLAKAALYAGAKILMRKKGVDKVDAVTLAGAFGSYINKVNALVIGMVPDCNPEAVIAVGNAAGEGAKLALFDLDKRGEAQAVASVVHFVETATEADFQKEFMDAMFLPHASDRFPHIDPILERIPRR